MSSRPPYDPPPPSRPPGSRWLARLLHGGKGRKPDASPDDWAADLDWVSPRELEAQQARRKQRRPFWQAGATVQPTANPRSPHAKLVLRRRIAALLVLAVGIFALWFLIALFQPFYGSGSGEVTVNIPRGATAGEIGDQLARDGVISSSFFFNLRASIGGDRGKLRAGVFHLEHGMSYSATLAALTSNAAGAYEIAVTIPEGYSREEIAKIARADGLVGNYVVASRHSSLISPQRYGAHADVHQLEGFMFPDTYYVPPHSNVTTLIAEQIAAFKSNFAKVNMSYARSVNLTPYDVLTIASIIPREAQQPSDYPKVAAVIYNRLKAGMTLGLDTTLLYYFNDPTLDLTNSDLRTRTPYNTGLYRGLPPTPIGNPGLAALQAAAHPTLGFPDFYFIVNPKTCGYLSYAITLPEFESEEAVYNAAAAGHGGIAPEKCS
jgi:UPF0755 protein